MANRYRRSLALLLLLCFPLLFCAPALGQTKASKSRSAICQKFLDNKCDPEQEMLLKLYLGNIDIYSLAEKLKSYPNDPPAFDVLPKDREGFINWNKAVTEGIIRPKGSLIGELDRHEGFFANLMVFPTKIPQIPDVLFPHGLHTYWLSCESCHPEPFKKERGANSFTMGDIISGDYCGKCHGKVSFPPQTFTNCSRCHILQKTRQKVWQDQ